MFVIIYFRCFVGQIELSGLQVDVALRKFQSYFRMPVSAKKQFKTLRLLYSSVQFDLKISEEFQASQRGSIVSFVPLGCVQCEGVGGVVRL